jgi:ER lumen protein retaining receptor
MMNVFRLAGDMSHVVSIFILLLRLLASKQATGKLELEGFALAAARPHSSFPPLGLPCVWTLFSGISLKTQEMFLLVFITRYLDLFTTFYSAYNR